MDDYNQTKPDGGVADGGNAPPKRKNAGVVVLAVILAVGVLLGAVAAFLLFSGRNGEPHKTGGESVPTEEAFGETDEMAEYWPGTYTVPASGGAVRLWEDHASDASPVGTIPAGTELTVTEVYFDALAGKPEDRDWGQTEYEGQTGWVRLRELSFDPYDQPPLEKSRLWDMADLLTLEEKRQLSQKLDEVSERLQFDLVIFTTDSLSGYTPGDYADTYYDSNGYGYGESRDGALLLISMEGRDWWISTCGFGTIALADDRIEAIGEDIVPSLTSGNYSNAFSTFIDDCDSYVTQAKSSISS